ncbi:MAG: amidohydrolase [Dysgonomonas sp.]
MNLRITIVQYDIIWEDISANLSKVESLVKNLEGKTDIIILPEMFSTGFSMNSRELAEERDGKTVQTLKKWTHAYKVAVCGSFIAKENGNYYNRGFFISSDTEKYYDKRHLFRMSKEHDFFSNGNQRLIFEHKGFKICLLICYDLRFPVWARNVGNEYDLLVYVANWPKSRKHVWKSLLTARAIENMAYVCGVNRVGTDGNRIQYSGNSVLLDAKGFTRFEAEEGQEQVRTIEISREELTEFRDKFPVWKDADRFIIEK